MAALRPLPPADLALVCALQDELGAGDAVAARRWAELTTLQHRLAMALDVAHGPANATETFALIREPADVPPLTGPRWWFHLLGLRHGAAHVVLTTPQGWFVAQRRSRHKDDAPGALDVAVSGHCGTSAPLATAWREMHEEVGIAPAEGDEPPSLAGDALRLIAVQDVMIRWRAAENPPFIDRERHWIYAATLTAAGMARLRFRDSEVTSLLLVGPDDLAALAARCRAALAAAAPPAPISGELPLAPGLVHTLPLWLDQVPQPAE
jgi:isopentenyldiphosphate isomerase